MQKGLDAFLGSLVMEDLVPAFLDNRPDLRRLILVQRTMRFQQHGTGTKIAGKPVALGPEVGLEQLRVKGEIPVEGHDGSLFAPYAVHDGG
jgi:hypothetical protein